MSKGLTDAQIEKLADRIIKFETKKGSFQGDSLTIKRFTDGNPYTNNKIETREDLIGLIKDYYIPAVKKDLGEENFNKLDTSIIYELADWNFNSGRSATDVLAYAAGDITLDKWNDSGKNPLPKNFDKITLKQVEAAKHDGYKTDGKNPATKERYTIEEPNPAYGLTWKHRIGSTQDNPDEYKKYFEDKETENTERRAKLKKVGIYNDPKSSLRIEGTYNEKTDNYDISLDDIQQEEIKGVSDPTIPTVDTPVASSTEDTTTDDEENETTENTKTSNTLKDKEQIVLGDRTITITDPYGIRGKNFKNREGQHSKGIDILTDNKRVISLTDGVVEVAKLQGSPTLVGTGAEKSGGYYLIIKNDDGTRSQYMHLDAMTPQEQKDIIGKKVKRGDDIGGYGIGSGSGTGPHVKYRVFTGELGTQTKTHVDPSNHIKSGFKEGYKPSPKNSEKTIINFQNKEVERNGTTQYETSWTNPDGETHNYFSFKENEVEVIGNNTYLSDGKWYHKFGTKDDANNAKRYTLEATYENELVDLEKKVKKGNHLNKKELQFAEQITKIKEDEVQEKIEIKENKFEGFGRELWEKLDNSKDRGRDKERLALDKERLKIRERLLKNIVIPESQAYLKEQKEQRKENLEKIKRQSLNGSLSAEKLKSAKIAYDTYNKETKIFNKNLAKKELEIESYKSIGEEVYSGGKVKRDLSSSVNSSKRPEYGDSDQLTIAMNYLNGLNIPENINESETATQKKDELLNNQQTIDNDKEGVVAKTETETETEVEVKPTASEIDPTNIVGSNSDKVKEVAGFVDQDYIDSQNSLDQETIDFIKNQKEVTSEIPEEEEEDYDAILGTMADIGKGVIGLAGATEELPDYNTGQMYNEYADDARRMKNEGLSAEEENYMVNKAKTGFEFGMKQYRGAGSSSALLGASNQAQILQDSFGKIAAIDQGVRRDNRKEFARAALTDENIQRKKFEDEYNEIANNKKEGAALARDSYNNASERVQFEKQYGKGSQYQTYMNEQISSMRQNREYAKKSRENTDQQAITKLQKDIDKRNKKSST